VYLWTRLGRMGWLGLIAVPLFLLTQPLAFGYMPRGWAMNGAYALLALMILMPALLALRKRRFRDGGLLVAAVLCFGLALLARLADRHSGAWLPMGTHWLWHLFGAGASQAVALFLYRLNSRPVR